MSGIPDITLNHHRFRSSPHFPSAATPMTIPRAQEQPVPPPLPPPTYIPISPNHDPGWQWGNDPNGSDFGKSASVKAGSSLLGGAPGRPFGGRADKDNDGTFNHSIDWARRGSAISTATTATITGNNNDMADSGSVTPSDDGSISRPGSNYRYVRSISCVFVFSCHQGTMGHDSRFEMFTGLCFTTLFGFDSLALYVLLKLRARRPLSLYPRVGDSACSEFHWRMAAAKTRLGTLWAIVGLSQPCDCGMPESGCRTIRLGLWDGTAAALDSWKPTTTEASIDCR